MDNREIAQTLKNLVLLDIEATREYDWAIDHIGDESIREQLSGFKEDHLDHADNISMYIRQLGERMPSSREITESKLHEPNYQPGFKSEEILKTLVKDEKLIAKRYEEALENVFVPEIVSDLENDFEDDQMHAESIQGMLSRR
ncbi:MAG: ferritin-like domain-containing protein [Chitinispirillaceae bacterium]